MKATHPWPILVMLASTLLLGACSNDENPASDLLPDDSEPEIWRFALEEIGGSVQDAWAQEFRRRIEDISDGEVQVEIYPYGSIGTSPQVTRLVMDGRVHLAFASPGHIADDVPEAGVFLLPFLFPDDEAANRQVLADPQLRSELEAAWQASGLQLLDLVPEGWMIWSANRPLLSPDDFSGLRMRTMTAPLQSEVFSAWGAEPVPMPYAEVYDALQLGQVDGQSNPAFAIAEMKFHEVQSVLTHPRATRFVASVVSNRDWYSELDDTHRQWLEEVRDDMSGFADDVQREYNQRRLQQIKESGRVRVETLDEAQRGVFRQAATPVRDNYRETAGDRGSRILDRVLKLTGQHQPEASR